MVEARVSSEHDPRYPVMLHLPVREFRRLLPVVLDLDAPDDLTNRLLGDASQPHAGLIRFRLTARQAQTLLALVRLWCEDPDEHAAGMAEVLSRLEAQMPGTGATSER